MTALKQGEFTTGDGVTLRYLEAGAGRPLLMLPAWSQAAEEFKFQLEALSDRHRVIALDFRGHGDSDKPTFGYRIARLAKDVFEFMAALDLRDVTILGHSMGNSVIWCYWDLFGRERLAEMIIVDQPPFIVANPAWSEQERLDAGALWGPEETTALINRLADPHGADHREFFVTRMLPGDLDPQLKAWIVACSLKLPRTLGARLQFNHAHQDWHDVFPRIDVPTLVIGGRVSTVPWRSQMWIAEQIPHAKLRIFEPEEGGTHFMFITAPVLFNAVLRDFMA